MQDNTEPIKQQQQQQQALPSMIELKEIMQSNRKFRVHVFVAGIASAIVSIVNLISQLAGSSYPWATFVYGFFCMTLSFHYFIFNRQTRELLNLHFAWFATIVGVNTIIWIWAESPYCWPLNIVFGWGIVLGAHWAAVVFRDSPHRGLYIHLSMFTNLQLLLLVIFLNSLSRFPWFLISFLGTAIFPLIHWTVHYHPGNWFRLHLALYADINLICFFTWLSTKGFPWFYIVLFVLGAFLALHFIINRRKNDQYKQVQTATDSSFTVQIPISQSPPVYQPPVVPVPVNTQPVPMVYPQTEVYRPQLYPQTTNPFSQSTNPFPPTYQQIYTPDPQNKI